MVKADDAAVPGAGASLVNVRILSCNLTSNNNFWEKASIKPSLLPDPNKFSCLFYMLLILK